MTHQYFLQLYVSGLKSEHSDLTYNFLNLEQVLVHYSSRSTKAVKYWYLLYVLQSSFK